MRYATVLCALVTAAIVSEAAASHVNTASGKADAVPHSYAPPLVSNGSLSMLIDYEGGQTQRRYVRLMPGVWWAGRRHGPPRDLLNPFGFFENKLVVDGEHCGAPTAWTQTLDTRSAVVTCRNEYEGDVTVETSVFVPLDHDLVVIKRRLTTKTAKARKARMRFQYRFTPPGGENRWPWRVDGTCAWNEKSKSVEFRYHADTYRSRNGIIAVFSDKEVSPTIDGQVVTLAADVTLDAEKPVEATFYLLLADSLDGKDYLERAAKLQALVRGDGYDGLLAAHRKAWAAYWDRSYVHLPDERLERVYTTAQYHLRSNATKWSFPVGILPTHWAARFFGWDEMFCFQALASSNRLDISRRCPEFRRAGLKVALQRVAHYGKAGKHGARYPWESMEDGKEAAPPGFWMDHVFHMSNIAQSCWQQYQYTADAEYLKATGYPVIKECARFFLSHMVYEREDGRMFIGKCTDLERLGPDRQNPFMTSCGAIYTMEAAAEAAALLKTDEEEAKAWKDAAAKLRESLPNDGQRYLPYAGCEEASVASLGGLFPYPLFDAENPLQKRAAYWFVEHGQRSGNMYPVGKSLCAWYAGWLAAALAALDDTREPAKLLSKAAEGAGCFAELFEINEPEVSIKPWFATASGNVVYAANQMLLQCRGDQIRIAPGAPEAWKDYSFKLACHGDLVAEAAVGAGRLGRLALAPGNDTTEYRRTLIVPARLLDGVALNQAVVESVETQGANKRLTIRFKGPTEIIERK